MFKSIPDIVPDPELLLTLEPEELGGVILEHLNSLEPSKLGGELNRYNFSLGNCIEDYPLGFDREEIMKVLMEGWGWLEREGLLAPTPGRELGWFFVTRRGSRFTSRANYIAFRNADVLPSGMLHPNVAEASMPSFSRGEYDTAVFKAYRQIEIAVRESGGYAETDYGTGLMRQAFDDKSGPLSDTELPKAEQEALSHLFAGAIGLYKNPHSHRNVSLGAEEAAEMVILASHLLKIVESRSAPEESDEEPDDCP